MKRTPQRTPPSELAERQETIKKRMANTAKLRKTAIRRCLATSDGKVLLKYLMDQCGYQKSSVQASSTTGEHLENNTQYNEGRRDVYLGLRRHAREDILFDVEIKGDVPDHELLA